MPVPNWAVGCAEIGVSAEFSLAESTGSVSSLTLRFARPETWGKGATEEPLGGRYFGDTEGDWPVPWIRNWCCGWWGPRCLCLRLERSEVGLSYFKAQGVRDHPPWLLQGAG